MELLYPENRKIIAFIRRHKHECILVVANFSRLFQFVELDLSEFQGMVPATLYGRMRAARNRRFAIPSDSGFLRIRLVVARKPDRRTDACTSDEKRRTAYS